MKSFFVAGEERAEVSAGKKERGHILKIHPLSYPKQLFYFTYIIILRIKKISKSTLAEDMINRIASLNIPNQILQPLKS